MTSNSPNVTVQQSMTLPKLPKVLGIIANSVNSEWQDSAKIYAAQISMNKEEASSRSPGSTVNNRSMTDQAKSMSASLALLRKEMSSLRQLDGYLLCQLMSLHSSITELKSQEDDILLSESSADLILEDDEELDEVMLSNGRVTFI